MDNPLPQIVEDPDRAVATLKLNFDDMMGWQKAFHIMQPITSIEFVSPLMRRLQNSGAEINVSRILDDGLGGGDSESEGCLPPIDEMLHP